MSVLRSKLSDVEIPEDTDLCSLLFQGIDQCADKPAIIHEATGEEITYKSLARSVNSLAVALHEKGISKGDVVCVFAEKSILGTVALFSIFKLGAVMTPCRPSHTARELATQLQNSQSKALIFDKHLVETAKAVAEKTPAIQNMFSIGEVEGKMYDSLDSLIKSIDPSKALPNININPKKDLLAVIYSSGTTGLPKGVMITHHNMITTTVWMSDPRTNYFSTKVLPQTAPPFHVGGLAFMILSLYTKKLLVLYTGATLVDYLKMVKRFGITTLPMFPNHLLELSKFPEDELNKFEIDFSEITIFTGGSVFSATNSKEVLRKTKAKSLIQGYGATETSGFISADDVDNFVVGSAGLTACNTQLKIVDMTTHEILGPHQNGEICVNSPGVAIGYLNNPKATAEAFQDGWFKTGDVGYYDETGHIFIVDRIKDVIKYKGMQVAPSEIEEVIYTHPAVKAVCVVPVEDDSTGEVPLACVVLKDGQSASEDEIRQLVKDNLADYKWLRGGVMFMKKFPLTPLGKIMRKELRNHVQVEIKQKET